MPGDASSGQAEDTTRLESTLKLGAIGLSLLTATAFLVWVKTNRIGPRVFWASDVCPDPGTFCGVVPASVFVAALIGTLMAGVGIRVADAITGKVQTNGVEG